MLCVGQNLAYCVYLVAPFTVLFSAVNVYVFYEQIHDDDDDDENVFCNIYW